MITSGISKEYPFLSKEDVTYVGKRVQELLDAAPLAQVTAAAASAAPLEAPSTPKAKHVAKLPGDAESAVDAKPTPAAKRARTTAAEGDSQDPASPLKKPRKPRAPTSYQCYIRMRRPVLAQAHADLSFGDMMKTLGEEWSKLDDFGRAPYIEMAAAEKVKFDAEHPAAE